MDGEYIDGWLRGRWEVAVKGGPNQKSYEISIVHEYNDHGKGSYGWEGPEKLTLSTSYQNTHSLPEPVWNDLVALAVKWAAERSRQSFNEE